MHTPRLFALTREVGDVPEVVGYGLELPDGSAYSVSWPPNRTVSSCSAGSAERAADLLGAELHWIGDRP